MLDGLCAFPLTPLRNGEVDEAALAGLVAHLAGSGVDSLGVLGSTGGYAYLSRAQRRRAAATAVDAAGGVPVVVGVGATSTRDVLGHVEDAAAAGAAGVLLPPVSYQPLTEEEVLGLYADVTARCALPVAVYDNPTTTGFRFTPALHGRIAHLPGVAAIKVPPVPVDPAQARRVVDELRALVPPGVTISASGDAAAATGLLAGCDGWSSVLAGVWPRTCLEVARSAAAGDAERAHRLSDALAPVWSLFARLGSYRVASALAVETGLLGGESLHAPVLPLRGADRDAVRAAVRSVGALD